MFTYIDPTVRKRLEEHGKLFQIDREGVQVPARSRAAQWYRYQRAGTDPIATEAL